jgi:hypothetical protein
LKQALVDRFSDKLPDQYYYTRLQESTEEFGDRCRKLCQRKLGRFKMKFRKLLMRRQSADLAAYIHGLKGTVGQQVQFQMPTSVEQAVKLAVTVENVEKHRQMVGVSRKVFANRKEINAIGVMNRGIMLEIVNNSRAHVTERRFKGIVITVGVLTVTKGSLIGNALINMLGQR